VGLVLQHLFCGIGSAALVLWDWFCSTCSVGLVLQHLWCDVRLGKPTALLYFYTT
jgi:hypothetical protein